MASVAAPLPRSAAGGRLELRRVAPSGRSLLVGILILLTGFGLYAAARTTPMFAVDRIAVYGASSDVAGDVRTALAPAVGESLLGLDLSELESRTERIPAVASATFDRAFPHTLSVVVVPEVPAAVLRQGASSWLAAASGRIVAELERGERPSLPRIWLKRDVDVRVGESVNGLERRAVIAVAPLLDEPLPVRVATVVATRGELTLLLRSGVELRLGGPSDLPVKLEVARRVLPRLDDLDVYLDVSVPARPVAGQTLNSKVEIEPSPSTPVEGSD